MATINMVVKSANLACDCENGLKFVAGQNQINDVTKSYS